jgi:Mce-associated membrane protein
MPASTHHRGRGPNERRLGLRLVLPDPPPDVAEEPATPRPRPRPPGIRSLRLRPPAASPTTWLLAALLVVALAGLGWTGARWRDAHALPGAHQAALAAARQITVDFVTISASSVDSDLQRIVDGATGDFRGEFTRGMPQVRQAVVENQVESTGAVLRAGLVSGDRDSAVVLVAVDASVKNVGAPEGRLLHYRIQVDMALDPESGRWLVSRLQFVG